MSRSYALSHVSDQALLRDLSTLIDRDRRTTAELLAHLAEVDARRLYLPAGYPSMHAYCVGELKLSEDSANKRIRVARLAREYPRILDEIAEGRLNLSGVVVLGAALRPGRADEVLSAAVGRSRCEIEELVARLLPRTESMTIIESLPAKATNSLPAPGPVESPAMPEPRPAVPSREAARRVVAPIAGDRFSFQMTIGRETRDKLRRAQDLLSHALPSVDVAAVLDRALDALIEKLEKRKFGATSRPRVQARPSSDRRHIPARVRRAVRARDGDRCTFVSGSGHRCFATSPLEFDHIEPVARGGRSTLENLRLRCRAHNQYAAERAFGAAFMEARRNEARGGREDPPALVARSG